MKITEEQNETVVHFGRILTEKEIALMEICLAFFQGGDCPNASLDKVSNSDGARLLNKQE